MRPANVAARLKSVLVRSVVRLRRFRLGHSLARGAAAFVSGFENRANYHIDANGETELVRRLAAFDPLVVFDVGANVGEWSCLAAAELTGSKVYSFEPVPETATQLRGGTRELGDRVEVHQVALGRSTERRHLSIEADRSAFVSLLDPADPNSNTSIVVDVITGDDFCDGSNINHIDLLKIDAEGFDYFVLAGFDQMLRRQSVDVIQFEYGIWALGTKWLLYDFYEMLEGFGYCVGKLYPRGVAFGTYDVRLEDFKGLNFVAVSNLRPDIIAAISEA